MSVKHYEGELKTIIDNGYKLGKDIADNPVFFKDSATNIKWTGNQTHKKDPIDIYVDNIGFSLKEDSFILKNMGLYEFLNNMTGSNYKKGLHVFNTFAQKEYDHWFLYTWQSFINYLSKSQWKYTKANNISEATKVSDNIIFKFNSETKSIPIGISTNAEYMKHTTSKLREKVFAKWINEIFSTDKEYIRLKNICSTTAGKNITNLINSNYNPTNITNLFQILDFDYYYAKTTSNETTILLVPSKKNFSKTIQLLSCKYEVPSSQLNIITTFINTTTRSTLSFRNECRFSHGQFNGTPEAKMYIVKNTPLTSLYTPL